VTEELPDEKKTYSTAKSLCSTIGARVASGAMPPPSSGLSLTSAQKGLVAEWVKLGCPETPAQASSVCAPAPSPSTPAPSSTGSTPPTGTTVSPPPTGTPTGAPPAAPPAGPDQVSIQRAEWSNDGRLRVEGQTSDPNATLTLEFSSRREPVDNAGGRFRIELNDVMTNPMTVTVVSSSGGSATANVVAN